MALQQIICGVENRGLHCGRRRGTVAISVALWHCGAWRRGMAALWHGGRLAWFLRRVRGRVHWSYGRHVLTMSYNFLP
jgi:hypothetical protein